MFCTSWIWLLKCFIGQMLLVQYKIVRASSMVMTKFEAVPHEDAHFCPLDPKVEIPLTYSLSSCGIFCSTLPNFGQCSAYVVDKEEKTCECGMAACSDANGGNPNLSAHVHVECIQCPEYEPYAVSSGQYCSAHQTKIKNSTWSTECDGSRLEFDSGTECVHPDLLVPCPSTIKPCKNNPNGIQPFHPKFPPIVVKYHVSAVFERWKPENILDPACDDFNVGNYYLATASTPEIWIDVGLLVVFTSVSLRNTHSGHYHDRAAKEITIAVSKDEAQWDPAITVELIDTLSSSPTCNIPLEKFPLPFVYGRYMKFTIDSYYGDLHGGIGYMVVEYFQ